MRGWTSCGSARRRTPARATRSPRPAGGCRWSRWTPATALIGPHGPVTLLDAFEGRRSYRLLLHVAPRPPRGRAVRGLHLVHHARSRELSYLHSRDITFAVFCQGPFDESSRYREFMGWDMPWYSARGVPRHAPRRTHGRHDAPRVLPPRRRPRLRDLLDHRPRRRGDGQQLRAAWTSPSTAARRRGRTRRTAGRRAEQSDGSNSASTDAPSPSGRASPPAAPTTSDPHQRRIGVITFVLSPDVLGQTRFTFSPLTEATLSLRLLGQPRPTHVHTPWLRQARDRLRGVDLELLMSVVPTGPYIASCLVPAGTLPQPSLEDQLTDLTHVSAEELERDLRQVWSGRALPRTVVSAARAGARRVGPARRGPVGLLGRGASAVLAAHVRGARGRREPPDGAAGRRGLLRPPA